MYLQNFQILKPDFQTSQEHALDWLAWAHSIVGEAPLEANFARKLFARFAGREQRIAFRSYELPLYGRYGEEAENLFRKAENFPLSKRMEFFRETCEKKLDEFYRDETRPPQLLVHVTCTGYISPSAAQKIVVKKGWGRTTAIQHAYHMGCCAAFPAVRSAMGYLSSHLARPEKGSSEARVDLVHNELCTLHLNPVDHSPEQMVVQSLFADGHIRYQVTANPPQGKHFEILAVKEQLVENSSDAMTWKVDERGFQMTLSRDVPERITGALGDFIGELEKEAGVELDPRKTIYAIHPGGPRLIDAIKKSLKLEDWQVQASLKVLRECGNMSSVTIPHIWSELLGSAPAAPGTAWVISLAFGPGLTIFGSIMRRVVT